MRKLYCDLCGVEIKEGHRRLKVKEYKRFGDCSGWEKIDAHDRCVKDLLKAVRYARGEEDD